MNKMNKRENYSDEDWEKLAMILSEEPYQQGDLGKQFANDDSLNTAKLWTEIRDMGGSRKIDVEKAWMGLSSKLGLEKTEKITLRKRPGFNYSALWKAAAIGLILIGMGLSALYISNDSFLRKKIVIATGNEQTNQLVNLPDGSSIYLNRNTLLSYRKNFGDKTRSVSLSGEAFFDIAPDVSKPFSINAGKAIVKVVGTSFNVITQNDEKAVEVYVKTGKVELSDSSGTKSMFLEPEYIGIMNSKISDKTINKNKNYLSWNTGLLVYDGEKLNDVLKDLKRVYDMDIIADDPSILDSPWKITIDNQSQETIIHLICASFNLNYSKDGSVYHLVKR